MRSAHEVTASYDAYRDFVRRSRGEFSVAKNVFVATGSGWFGDRSAAYLAAGRPVVVQDTGVAGHLPSGDGLFAVRDVEEAAGAVERIEGDYARHSARRPGDRARVPRPRAGAAPAARGGRAVSAPLAVSSAGSGSSPTAGVTMYYVHHVLGLQELGYRVHYVERQNRPSRDVRPVRRTR